MNVVVYRVKVQGKYTYNYSLNPEIDYLYLKSTYNIKELEVITPFIPFYIGKFALKIIKKASSKIKFIASLEDRKITRALKSLNIEKVSNKIIKGNSFPKESQINYVLNAIEDGIITIDCLREKTQIKINTENLYDVLQVLYLKNKIKIKPIYGNDKKNKYCDICTEVCEECFLGYSSADVLIYKEGTFNEKGRNNIVYKKSRIKEELVGFVDSIYQFTLSKNDNLVVSFPPIMKGVELLYGAIYETLKSSGKVIYITSKENVFSVRDNIKSVIEGVDIYVFNKGLSFKNIDILICSYESIPEFSEDFELCILDDRISFINKPYNNIFFLCKKVLKQKGKFINTSVVPLEYKLRFLKGSSMEIKIPPVNIKNPIPEPKFIISRYIDEKTVYLPDISLDMLKWSLREKSKMIIFTPNSRISIHLKNYLLTVEEIKENIGISSSKNREDYYSFLNGEKTILISSNYLDALEPIYNVNVVVMYSDSKSYTEDVLLYMCNMANDHTKKTFREAFFISNTESKNMLNAKSIIRSINKSAWENGYIGK